MHLAAVALAFLLAAPGLAAAARQGPLPVRTQNPLHLLYLGQRPIRAVLPPAGTLQVSVEAGVSNLLERTPISGGWELDLDLEIWRFVFATRYAPAPWIDLGLEVPLLRFDGGFLDGPTDAWHALIGNTGGRRVSVERDRFSYRLAPDLGVLYDLEEVPIGLSDLTLDVRLRLLRGGDQALGRRPALALQVAGKLPTGSWRDGLGSGAPDLGAWLLLEHGGRLMVVHASLGLIVPGPAVAIRDIQAPAVLNWMVAGELRVAPPFSVLVQIVGATPRLLGIQSSNETAVTLDLAIGVRGTARGWTWQVAFVEDLITLGPSVDFTALASIGRTFGE